MKFVFFKFPLRLRHRGPDWSGIYCKGNNIICHERLAIVDPDSGDQPLYSDDGVNKYTFSPHRYRDLAWTDAFANELTVHEQNELDELLGNNLG